MKHKLFSIFAILLLFGCDNFTELTKELQEQSIKNDKVFKGKKSKLIKAIRHKYNAEFVNVGIGWSSFNGDSHEWMGITIHNGDDLSDEEELWLAKIIYHLMDTSLINGDYISIKQSFKKGNVIHISSSSSQHYYYHQLDSNVKPPEAKTEDVLNVEGILDSLIVLNNDPCNTKFYQGLLNSWKGDLAKANSDFLNFEACDVDRNHIGRYREACTFMVLLINQKEQVEINEGVELLVPGLDSLKYNNYSLFSSY